MSNYSLNSPPPGKVLAEVGTFRNVNRVSLVVPGDGQPIRQNVGTAANQTGSVRANYFLQPGIRG